MTIDPFLSWISWLVPWALFLTLSQGHGGIVQVMRGSVVDHLVRKLTGMLAILWGMCHREKWCRGSHSVF